MRGRQDETTPAGPYEVRYRLEDSYRKTGIWFLVFGIIGFLIALVTAEPWLWVASGPAAGAGIWVLRNDPREYLVLEPRRKRLRLVRTYGKKNKVRGEYNLREYNRLETAIYLNRPKGERCMIVLFRPDGSVEKVDDRVNDEELVQICRNLAAEAGLEFVDRGRIDEVVPPRMTTVVDDEPVDVETE